MPEIYIPGAEVHELLATLTSGFLIDVNEDGAPVLLLKFDAAILGSIIAGSPVNLLINNPKITDKSLSLEVYDNQKYPMWVDGNTVIREDKTFLLFDELAIKLAGITELKVALFNEANLPVFTTNLPVVFNRADWDRWMMNIYNNPDFDGRAIPNLPDEPKTHEIYQSFILKLSNKDHRDEEKLVINQNITEGKNAGKLDIKGYNFNNFLKNGNHGRNQELSIKNILGTFFEIDREVFIAPNKSDGTELTDFVLLLEDTYVLIESKYVVSIKATKAMAALSKAVEQLSAADNLIRLDNISLENKALEKELLGRKYNLKICLHNDNIMLTDEKCAVLAAKYDKMQLPMFMSVTVFNNFLSAFHIKNEPLFHTNLRYNLVNAFYDYYTSDIPVLTIRNFGFDSAS